MELPQCLDRKVKRQRMGLQAPFETGDYNGVSEELRNLHRPNANRNSAKSAVLQVRRVQAISRYMEREGNDPIEETAGFVAELSAQYGCEAFFRHFSGWDASWRTQPEMWMAELREEVQRATWKAWRKQPRPMSGEQTAEASPSERSAHIGQ